VVATHFDSGLSMLALPCTGCCKTASMPPSCVTVLDENHALLPPLQVAASEWRLLPAASWWQCLLTCGCIHCVPQMHQEVTEYRPAHVAAAQRGVPGRRCGGDASQAGAAASNLPYPQLTLNPTAPQFQL